MSGKELNLRDSISYVELFASFMEFEGKPEFESQIKALKKVAAYAKEQYCKQELADVMNGVKGGGDDGRTN